MLHKDQRIFLTPEGLPPDRIQVDPPRREIPPVIIRSRIIEGFGLALKIEIINATEITPFFRCFQPLSAITQLLGLVLPENRSTRGTFGMFLSY